MSGTKLTAREKYADPAVVGFWQALGRQGLQLAEAEMVRRYLVPAGTLLDLGCGAGRAVLALNGEGYTVTGIDLSLPMLQAGHALSGTMRLSGANLLNLPFAEQTFQAAFMFFGALQHIAGRQGRRQALTEMRRVVKPGGRLVLGLDNLAPALLCYAYWFKEKLARRPVKITPAAADSADNVLWTPRQHPLAWHVKGIIRSLRWRTWPGLVDAKRAIYASPGGLQIGDIYVAQFSQPATPGQVYYHMYRPTELIADAQQCGWELLGFHSGRELSEGVEYPVAIRGKDKQLFFAFETAKED